MPIKIDGVAYFTAADIQREVGVVRQTLWRWRKGRKIPQGRRYRDKNIVFTRGEVDTIREYSNRLEPADARQPRRQDGDAERGRVTPRPPRRRVVP